MKAALGLFGVALSKRRAVKNICEGSAIFDHISLFLHVSNILLVQICPTCVRVGAFSAGCFTAKHLTMLGLFGVSLSTQKGGRYL